MALAQSNAGRVPKHLRDKRARLAKAGSPGGKTTYDRHLEKDAAVVAGANPAVMAKLTDDQNVIMNDDVFTGIDDADPYNIIDTGGGGVTAHLTAGHQSPFDSDEATHALNSTSRYNCAVNFFWFNVASTPNPQLPIWGKWLQTSNEIIGQTLALIQATSRCN